jgi:arylsulfatase A-like enzyme
VKKYLKLWILPLILVSVSFGLRNLARLAWDSLVHFNAPQFSVEPGEEADPIARVVIVVADGLRVDTFNKMKFVSSLKDEGAYFILKTGQPSLTMPCSTVIATGAWQDVTGVTTNWFEGPVRQDSLFSLAKDSGMASAIAGGDAWGKLFGSAATKTYTRKWDESYITFDEQTLQKAVEFLSDGAGLLLVHFVDTDEAGHDFGGASLQYQESADHIDSLIARLYADLPENTVLMITADHGQIDRGGHGGWEGIVTHVPFLMCGKSVKPGDYGKAEQTDIAPTTAALLGLPMPPYSQGRILDESAAPGAPRRPKKGIHQGIPGCDWGRFR